MTTSAAEQRANRVDGAQRPPAEARVALATRLVTMIDVDAVQISFRRYYDWIAHGYEAFFAEAGHPVAVLLGHGFAQPVAACACDFIRPVGLGAQLRQETWLSRTGRTSFELRDRFTDSQGLVAFGRTTRVWVRLGPRQEPEAVPDWLRDAAGSVLQPGHETTEGI
jgi:acyl-CoA thioesterase FadM